MENENILLPMQENGSGVRFWLRRNGAVSTNTKREAYTAVVEPTEVYNLRAIAERIAKAQPILKASTVEFVLEEFASMAATVVAEGAVVSLPGFVRFAPAVQGVFDAPNASFDPKKHKVAVHATVGRRMLKATDESKPIRVEHA